MPKTIVKCSEPGCKQPAATKIAAPWQDGSHAEPKTYGYACSNHIDSIVTFAERRPKPPQTRAEESTGRVRVFTVPKG